MALIEVSQLSLAGRLNNIDLELNAGEMTALIGPNGAGKSSLLSCMAGIQDYQGSVCLQRAELNTLAPFQRARSIAWMPQAASIAWPISVRDVVRLGRLPWQDDNETVIEKALQQTHCQNLAQRPVSQLSGGEQARVWLARILANEAEVLLLDEPLANLDINHQQQMMMILEGLVDKGKTVIMAIHDLNLAARHCHRFCLMNQGDLIRCGDAKQVYDVKLLQSVYSVSVNIDWTTGFPQVFPEPIKNLYKT